MNFKILRKKISILDDKALQEQNYRAQNLVEYMQLITNSTQFEISNFLTDHHRLISSIQLRGGGCCRSRKIVCPDTITKQLQIDGNFVTQLQKFTNIIAEKSLSFQDKMYQDEVLAAFQWFQNNKEQFHILCNNQSENRKNNQLIEKIIEQLMKQLIIYLKVSGFLFYSLLQICNDLLRIIFSHQLQNDDRYIQDELQKKLLEIIEEVESQMQVEAVNIWINGAKFELQMIKICVSHCRTNSKKGKELVISIVSGLFSSITSLKLNEELIDSLIEGGKFLLMNFYNKQIQSPLQVYEIYYYFENLKWSIVNQLKLGHSIRTIIKQIQNGYSKYIKLSRDWRIHYFWINLISDIMCYRPILLKTQLQSQLSQQTFDQETWNQLVLKLPYDKFAGRLKLFTNHNFTFKKYASLKLFQEYLIQNKSDIYLLPNFIDFNINAQQKEQLTDEELFIQSLTNQSNLEILTTLMKQLKYQNDQVLSNFLTVKKQVSQHDSQLNSDSHIEIKFFNQELRSLMNQFKQSSILLLYLINEINLLLNKEIQVNTLFQSIFQGYFQNLGESSKIIKEQILTAIEEIEKKHISDFLDNLQNVSQFWIQTAQYTTLSNLELVKGNLELENSLEISLNQNITSFTKIYNYLDKFHLQVSNIKRNFLKILAQKEHKGLMKESIGERNLGQIIITLFNPKLILKLIIESEEYYEKQLKKKISIENVKDVQILITIHSSINIYKGLQMILKQHHKRLLLMSTQFQIVFENTVVVHTENQQKYDIDIKQYIKEFILEMREKIQVWFQKYQNQEFTEEELTDFNRISIQISKEINNIKNMNWPEQIKTHNILLLSEIQLELISFEQQDRNKTQLEISKLLDGHLKEINSEVKTKEFLSLSKDMKQSSTKDELQKLKLKVLFDCEGPLKILEKLMTKSKKIKRIFKSNFWNTASKNLQTNRELMNKLKDAQTLSFKQAIIDLQQQSLFLFQTIKKHEQIIFDEEFIAKCQNKPNIDCISALLQIFNFDSLNFSDQVNQNQVGKVDLIQNMIVELQKETKIHQEVDNFDIFQNSSYKIRELVVFNLIKIQSIIQEQEVQEFCENLLKQIWIIEKHPSVRNVLKNDEMIRMQKKLFSQDLQNFSIKIKTEMQTRLKQIEQLETQILLSGNQDELKQSLQQSYDDFEIYLDNITDMSQRLDISLIFLREISKDLKNIKSSIDSILTSVKGVEEDIRRLRGKDFMELLAMRKQKILYQKQENEQDQIHIEIKTQEYDPISGVKKKNNSGEFITFLIKDQYENYDGEINEFLWSDDEKQKDVMLIKGKAGSGKSRASRNIEEFIWICDKISPNWIPIYVSLNQLKDPNHNLIEQALESETYNFDSIQIREFKDAVVKGKLKIVLILESYDEMKAHCIGTNLYLTNRFAYDLNLQSYGQTVKIIITTREEILNSLGYQTWFYGSKLQNLKEVEILPFSQEQSSQYLKIYAKISVKRTIKRFYEFLKQLKGQNFQLEEFKLIWSQIENTINAIISQRKNSEVLFLIQDVEKIIQTIQKVDFFSFIKSDEMLSLKKELHQLWGKQKFSSVIKNVNITHLLSTPFMMEIIVYVLPKMSELFSKTNLIRELLEKNFMILKREITNSEAKIESYSKQGDNDLNFEAENEMKIKMMKEFEIKQQFTQILEDLDNQKFFESFSIADSLECVNNTTIFSNKNFNVRFDANFIVSAFKLNQYTAFDFYEIFVNYYHNQQLQKLKDLGKSIKEESMLLDLQDFSIFLAIDMSMRQLTQVNFKQKGKLNILQAQEERGVEVSWEDSYFNEHQDDFEYKSLLRKCMLINSKGNLYAFNHKSIQEFYVAKYILNLIEKIFFEENRKRKVNQNILYKSRFNKNQFNLSLEHYSGTLELLKPKIKQIEDIKNKLIQIAQLSKKDVENNLIRSASNSIYILSSLREHFDNIDLSNLCLEDTKLDGISFYQCNLNNSQFNHISIDSCNFNCATIQNATWKKLICKEKPSLLDHEKTFKQVVFSDDGNILISASEDGVIIKWELSVDEEPKRVKLPKDHELIALSIGTKLFACLSTSCLYFYNLIDLREVKQFPLTSNYFKDIQDIKLSPNDKYLAILKSEGKILFFLVQNLQKYSQQQKYLSKQKNKRFIYSIAISPNCKLLATGDTQIIIWNAQNIQDIQQILKLPEQDHEILGIAFSKDNQVLAVGRDNKKLEFWNIQNLNQVQLQYTFDSQYSIEQIAYSNDGNLFAYRTCSSLKIYQVQKLPDQQEFFRVNSNLQVHLIEISSDCSMLASSHKENQQISIWDIKNLHQIKLRSILKEHSKNISTLKFRNDNLVLGSGSLDNAICLWDLLKLQLIVKLTTHLDQILDFAFSSDGQQMVTSSLDKKIIFWSLTNLDKPEIQMTLQQQLGAKIIIYCPKKQILVTLFDQTSNELKFWNSAEFKVISNYTIEAEITSINFSEDGEIMISLSQDRILRIWKINDQCFEIYKIIKIDEEEELGKVYYQNSQNIFAHIGQQIYQLQIQNEEVINRKCFSKNADCISVSQNNKIIAFSGDYYNNQIGIIVIENHNSQKNIYFEEQNCIQNFQFSSDSSCLAVATKEGAFIQDIKTSQILQNFQQNSCCFSICFIGGEQLAIALRDQLVLYDIQDLQSTKILSIIQLPEIPLELLLLEQRQQICIRSQNCLALLNLLELQQIQLIEIGRNTTSRNLIVDSKQLFIGMGEGSQIQFISLQDTISIEKIFSLQKYDECQRYFYKKFSKDSNIFSVLTDEMIYFQLDINSNQIIKEVNLNLGHRGGPCALNNQETLVILSKWDNQQVLQQLLLINLETQYTVSCFEEITDRKFKCEGVVYSQDGQNFVTSYSDLKIKLWDTKSCKLLSTFKTDTVNIQILKISRKGILAQTSVGSIKLWDLNALKQQQFEMDGHSYSVKQLSISSDGFQLVSGSEVEIIRWDLIELKKLDILIKGKRLPSLFCFSPDNKYFIATDDSGCIHIWKFNTKYITEFHKRYWCLCMFSLNEQFSVDWNRVIWENYQDKKFILSFEQAIKQKQLPFQSVQKIQSRTIILSTNLLIKTNPFEIIQINNKLELKNQAIVGIQFSQIISMAFCSISLRLALQDEDYSIIIWSIEKKQQVAILNSNEKNIKSLSMAFSGNSKILFSYHIDQKIRLWNITDKFELIAIQHLKEQEDSYEREIHTLHLFPIKDEEYIAIWFESFIVQRGSISIDGDEFDPDDPTQRYSINFQIADARYSHLELKTKYLKKFSVGFNEVGSLIALQFKMELRLYNISQEEIEVIAILEGNSIEEQLFSSILIFSSEVKYLLSLGMDHTIRLWDISDYNSIKLKVNLLKPVQALAFSFLNSETIRIFSESGVIIDQNISEYTEIGVIEDYNQIDFEDAKKQAQVSKYIGEIYNNTLEILDSQTKIIKYTLNKFSSEILTISFTPSEEQFILGMDDGSILFYKIDQQTLNTFQMPVCYNIFAKNPLLSALHCSIKQSIFSTIENENFEKVLWEKGAKNK